MDQKGHDLAAIAVKDIELPSFSSSDATIWFQRVEVLFHLRQVRNENYKADHLLAPLPEDTFFFLSHLRFAGRTGRLFVISVLKPRS